MNANNWLFTSAAQSGVFTYVDNNGVTQTVNLYQLAANGRVYPAVQYLKSRYPGCVQRLSRGWAGIDHARQTGDLKRPERSIGRSRIPTRIYYPAVRVDFTPNEKMRFNVAWNMTKNTLPGNHPPDFPGSSWAKTGAGDTSKNYSASFGFDWTLSPTIVNKFRGGYLYNAALFAYNAPPLDINVPQVGWNYPGAGGTRATQMNGTVDWLPMGTLLSAAQCSPTP